ncbi:hypothetical protein F66182_5130 [Fusarium sp. NRRL 66182]|nr:hypothetical protein F66182_5130 [Fusarium sp. NRRL 66182]
MWLGLKPITRTWLRHYLAGSEYKNPGISSSIHPPVAPSGTPYLGRNAKAKTLPATHASPPRYAATGAQCYNSPSPPPGYPMVIAHRRHGGHPSTIIPAHHPTKKGAFGKRLAYVCIVGISRYCRMSRYRFRAHRHASTWGDVRPQGLQRNWSLTAEACPISGVRTVFEIAWSMNIFADLLVFALPWFVIPELTIRRGLRYSLYFTFLLGLVNISITVVRFAQIEMWGEDLVISIALIALWSFADLSIGLIIACLPSLRPYFNENKGFGSYGCESESANNNTASSNNSHQPIVSSDQDIIFQPSNVHLSVEMQRRFSVA